MESLEQLLNTVGSWITTEGLKVVGAVLVLFISFKVINLVAKKVAKKLEAKNKFDPTIRRITINTVKIVVKVLIVVCIIGYLGFETTSISAAILSIGTTIGLALQGSLSNLAGGLLILINKPYKVGDYVVVEGVEGTVNEISLFYTYLYTTDNRVIIIPNSKTSNSCVTNVSKNSTRREDMKFTISYDQDFEVAKKVVLDVMSKNDKILGDPAPFVNVCEHGDSAIVILARWWTNSENYWDVHWYMLEEVKKAFDEKNISIPYPQLDVHLDK